MGFPNGRSIRRRFLICALALAAPSAAAGETLSATAIPAEVGQPPSASSQQAELVGPSFDVALEDAALDHVEVNDIPYEVLADDVLECGSTINQSDPLAIVQDAPAAVSVFSYNAAQSSTAWLPGDDDEFGIVSLENLGVLSVGEPSGLVAGFGVHFLDGPIRTEMPPRLFDFSIGYQRREWLRPNVGWDFAFRLGAFSDFEGSAKDGVRFPGHVVTFLRYSPTLTWLLGIDYLDRDDINLLPIFGAIWSPTDEVRLDLAFPRPRAAFRVMDSDTWLYLAGELGGGTWAIERDSAWDDNATYRDLRLVFGIGTIEPDGGGSALELGYVFDRELEYRSGLGDYSPDDCLMIRLVGRY